MGVGLGKDLGVEHRTMINAGVQYFFFSYFIISSHNKLAISKEHGGSIRYGKSLQFPFPDTGKALVGCSLAGL